jgi:hypothetical protein
LKYSHTHDTLFLTFGKYLAIIPSKRDQKMTAATLSGKIGALPRPFSSRKRGNLLEFQTFLGVKAPFLIPSKPKGCREKKLTFCAQNVQKRLLFIIHRLSANNSAVHSRPVFRNPPSAAIHPFPSATSPRAKPTLHIFSTNSFLHPCRTSAFPTSPNSGCERLPNSLKWHRLFLQLALTAGVR